MVQFAIKDEEELKFWAIYERIARKTISDLKSYFDNAYSSQELGRIIYEEQLLPIYKILEKSLFIKAFSEIVEGEKNLGTVESYLKILYAIFGKTAEITITTQPLHLKVDIVAPVQVFYLWITKDGKQIVTKDGKAIKFKQVLAAVSDRQLLEVLQSTTNAGTFVEFTLNREE